MLLGVGFVAMILLVLHVGAIAALSCFVVTMLNTNLAETASMLFIRQAVHMVIVAADIQQAFLFACRSQAPNTAMSSHDPYKSGDSVREPTEL